MVCNIIASNRFSSFINDTIKAIITAFNRLDIFMSFGQKCKIEVEVSNMRWRVSDTIKN